MPVYLSNFFTVQNRFHQFITAITQRQQEEGRVLPQKIQENLIALPFGQVIQKLPADPLQVTLIAFFQLSLKAIGSEKEHVLPFAAVIEKGDDASALKACEGQAGFLHGFPADTIVGAFLSLEFSADADPLILIDIILFFHPMEHEYLVSPGDIAQTGFYHFASLFKME